MMAKRRADEKPGDIMRMSVAEVHRELEYRESEKGRAEFERLVRERDEARVTALMDRTAQLIRRRVEQLNEELASKQGSNPH